MEDRYIFMLIDILMDELYRGNPEESLNAIKKSKVKDRFSDYLESEYKAEKELNDSITNDLRIK